MLFQLLVMKERSSTILPMFTGSINGIHECLSQPKNFIWMKTGQSAVIPCTVNSHCLNYNMEYKWFVFQENSHFEVNKDQSKYSLEGASLNIQSLNQTDSGIYHCAAVSSHEDPAKATQYIARGTTLVVKGKIFGTFLLV